MKKNNLKTKEPKDPLDIILNGSPKMKDHPNHKRALAIRTPAEETIHVKNPISGKETDIVLSRRGTTDEKLAMIMLSPDATKDQKDSQLAAYLFERGRENASFLAELFVSKGTHEKSTQAFKRQIRWDFEVFANVVSILFKDIADDIKMEMAGDHYSIQKLFERLAERLAKGAELIEKKRADITEARMREKGFGVYLDRQGKAFSIFDDEIVDVVKGDKEEIENEKQTSKIEDSEKDAN